MTEQPQPQPQTVINGEIHIHGLMSPEQIAEVIRNAYPEDLTPFRLPEIKSPSAEAAEAAKFVADNAAAGLAATFDENLNAVHADAAGAAYTSPSLTREQVEAEQCVAAYTRNSTGGRVVAHRWDGTKDSTANISRWLARHGEEVWFKHGKLHTRTLRNGATDALEVGDWVMLENNQAWSLSDFTFRSRYTWGEPKVGESHAGKVQSLAELQRGSMRALVEQLGDRGAMRLLLDVAGELDLEHC